MLRHELERERARGEKRDPRAHRIAHLEARISAPDAEPVRDIYAHMLRWVREPQVMARAARKVRSREPSISVKASRAEQQRRDQSKRAGTLDP